MKAVKENKSKAYKPKTKELNDCKEVVTTPEGALYAFERLFEVLKRSGAINDPAYKKALDVFEKHAKYMELAHSGGDPWSGKIPPEVFQLVQEGLAKASAAKINVERPILVDFAISDKAQLIKAFSIDGKALDSSAEAAMNEQLLAWLAQSQAVNKQGVLYVFDKTEKDQIKKGKDGKPERADPAAIAKLFSDPEKGFAAFVQKANSAAQVTVRGHDYAASQKQTAEPPTAGPQADEPEQITPGG